LYQVTNLKCRSRGRSFGHQCDRLLGAIGTGGIFDRFYKRFLNWIDFDTGGIFDRLLALNVERLKHWERLTYERSNPSFAASFVALGDNTEALSYFFELR
jgi:hypothetical protein